MTDDNETGGQGKVQLHVPQDLEYVYRDIVNIHMGSGEVIFEFGNTHRSPIGYASLSNRIVLSVENSYKLYATLGQALEHARKGILGEGK